MLKTNRSLGAFIVFSFLTFGIYPIAFWVSVGRSLNRIASVYDGKHTMNYFWMQVLSPFTLGIATLVWFHRISNRIGGEMMRRGYPETVNSNTYWLWDVLGSLIIVGPFIYLKRIIKAMNTLSKDFNSNY